MVYNSSSAIIVLALLDCQFFKLNSVKGKFVVLLCEEFLYFNVCTFVCKKMRLATH